MRLIVLSMFLFLTTGLLSAQITVGVGTLPAAGDTLKTVFDGMPSNIVINPSGGAIGATWDFSNLQGMLRETVYRPASDGTNAAAFPAADLVTSFGVAGENYFRISNNSLELIGYQGPDPANLGLDLSVQISPPFVEKRVPLEFANSFTDDGAILIPVAAADIPGGILDSLPVSPDSLRLRIASERSNFIEGWGSLTIPGGTYEVLREKRVELTETFLDVKIGVLPWIDVTDLVGFDFLGIDTTTTYNFYGETSKENIAVVTVDDIDNDVVLFVEYKFNDVMTNVRYVNNGKPDLLAYPNPAIEDVRLEFLNLKSGKYKVKIFNILGLEVFEREYSIQGDQIVKIDVSSFRKGTYLYSLINESGKTITTKRLIVMRP